MILIKNYSFKYGESAHWALKEINIEFNRGEFTVIAGPSGSGKSTLLRSINGLIPHFYTGKYCGTVNINGKNVDEMSPAEIAGHIGTLLQDPEKQVIMNTVHRELSFPLENMGYDRTEIEKRIEDVLQILDIGHLKYRKTSELSGGEIQKVALAGALIRHPKFLILDEPTTQLDPRSAEDIIDLLKRLNEDAGIGIIIVEHNMEKVLRRADRLILMKDGRIVDDRDPAEIMRRWNLDDFGVGMPPVSRIAIKLNTGYVPLSVKEALKVICSHVPEKANIKDKKSDEECIVYAKNIHFSYGSHEVLDGVNIKINKGEILAIVGKNGSGKTTLAKIILGLLKPKRGKVEYRIDKSKIGMVFQDPLLHIIGNSVEEDIAYTLKARGEYSEEKVKNIMKLLELCDVSNRNPLDLSGGERFRFALGTVLVFEPELLILDEPTRGLSWNHKSKLISLLKKVIKNGSVILISHDMDLIARVATRVAILSDGKIIVQGPKREVMCGTYNYTTQVNRLVSACPKGDRRILTEEEIM